MRELPKKMEETEQKQSLLLDLPIEVIENILENFGLDDRKSIRLTCKHLYKLCNADRFCRNETIRWSTDFMEHAANVQSTIVGIGRGYYNLVISSVDLKKSKILPFFEVHGAKIRTLVIKECSFTPGVLDPIIMLCDGLYSLTLKLQIPDEVSSDEGSQDEVSPDKLSADEVSDFFTIEPNTITRPKVTFLELTLPKHEPSIYFHRMISIFPNVNQLIIAVGYPYYMFISDQFTEQDSKTAEYSAIFDDIMNLGSNLKVLDLKIPLRQSIAKGSRFFEALPKLQHLNANFYCAVYNEPEQWYPGYSDLAAVGLHTLRGFHPPEMIRLLTNCRLKYLFIDVGKDPLVFSVESFKRLVASQLKIIHIDAHDIEGSSLTTLDLDSSLVANISVNSLYLDTQTWPELPLQLFPKYFRGLAHLSICQLTDSILQCIFQFQENLQSLKLKKCSRCSTSGFCGSKNDSVTYSINNLRNLEHLAIGRLPVRIIQSDDFQVAINCPRLKYLHIDCKYKFPTTFPKESDRFAIISASIFENITQLRALRLNDIAMPPRNTLLSLFANLKDLIFLRFDLAYLYRDDTAIKSVTFIHPDYCSRNSSTYNHAYTLGLSHFDQEINRVVILNNSLWQRFLSPKIGDFEINWIDA